MIEPLINIENIFISFEGNIVLENISFKGYPGKIYGLYGKNGTGKTTLINTLTGFNKPISGSIELYSQFINNYNSFQIAKLRGGVSRTFQVPIIVDDLTVYENLSLGRRLNNETFFNFFIKRRDVTDFKEEINNYVELFGLRPGVMANKLSYGEKRLLSILTCLLTNSRIVLLDEPFANLNSLLIEKLKSYFNDIVKKESKLIIIIEHQPDNLIDFVDILLHLDNKNLSSYEITSINKKELLEKMIDSYFKYE